MPEIKPCVGLLGRGRGNVTHRIIRDAPRESCGFLTALPTLSTRQGVPEPTRRALLANHLVLVWPADSEVRIEPRFGPEAAGLIFVAGSVANVQFAVKGSREYAGGRGLAQFGKPDGGFIRSL